ncbi:hypothetical protein ACFPRL_19215 [Pseudoclavibacter helvolus]
MPRLLVNYRAKCGGRPSAPPEFRASPPALRALRPKIELRVRRRATATARGAGCANAAPGDGPGAASAVRFGEATSARLQR